MSFNLSSTSPREFAEDFGRFITDSPTSFHASEVIASALADAGFARQFEGDAWEGHALGYVVRDGAIIAWRIPGDVSESVGYRIVGSHTDSPSVKVKPTSDSDANGYGQVNVEIYGGPLLNSWLNRDLGIAGRVVTIDGEIKLVKTGAVMVIPQLAPHLDRSVSKELKLSSQRDLHPIWKIGDGSVLELIAKEAGVEPDRIAATDLFAYDVQEPQIFGGSGDDFFAAGRQDNLSSAFASLAAFLEADASDGEDVLIYLSNDHEEIGSRTASGAAGPFLESVLRRLTESMRGQGYEVFERMLANSSCISADAGHAVNPNRPDFHDPAHRPVLGGGPLLKVNASGAYASEAQGSALFLRSASAGGVEAVQPIVSNNDVPSGSTIGPITATRLGITTVDCGIPLLSMHSVREISSPCDLLDMAKILAGYYSGA